MRFPFFQSSSVLRCRDIPREVRRERETETYPQKTNPIPAMEVSVIVRRYGPQIHAIIDNIPLPEERLDKLVMPVIDSVARLVHLLPASESHHHSGLGGLFLHSLEASAIAVRLAEQKIFDKDVTLEEKFHNSARWIVAAALLLLIHDIGKVGDMRIADEDGQIWNPTVINLDNWLKTSEKDSYFVDWLHTRIHNAHERRSLRFIYQGIFTEDVLSYLTADGNCKILDAIDDALLINEGCLSGILKEADSQSVAHDLARRENLSSSVTYVSSPLITPIIASMRENIESGLWEVNSEKASVFVTNIGVLLRATPQVGFEIRETAINHGYQGIPSNIDDLLQILLQNGFVEKNLLGDITFVNVSVCNQCAECVRFLIPDRLFPQGMPKEVLATLTNARETSNQKPENTSLEVKTTDYTAILKNSLLSDKSDSTKRNTVAPSSEALSPITAEEFAETLETPLGKEEATVFARRLFRDAYHQLRQGGGNLIVNRTESENSVTCSSGTIEQIATNHGISSATLEAIFQTTCFDRNFEFDAPNHNLRIPL